MITIEKLLRARELYKQEDALREKALEALQKYNRGKCKDRNLWQEYLDYARRADEIQAQAEALQ